MRTILFEIFHFAEQSQMKAGGNLFLKRIHQVPKQVSIFIQAFLFNSRDLTTMIIFQ